MNEESPLVFDESVNSMNVNQMGDSFRTVSKVTVDVDEEDDPFSF